MPAFPSRRGPQPMQTDRAGLMHQTSVPRLSGQGQAGRGGKWPLKSSRPSRARGPRWRLPHQLPRSDGRARLCSSRTSTGSTRTADSFHKPELLEAIAAVAPALTGAGPMLPSW